MRLEKGRQVIGEPEKLEAAFRQHVDGQVSETLTEMKVNNQTGKEQNQANTPHAHKDEN